MKYYTIDLNGQEINLRLTSQDSIKIESQSKTKLLDYIQDYSVTTIINLLRYMRKGGGEPNFSQQDAEKFFDQLVDNEYAIETIITDIIMPTCQVSGLLTKSDLELMMQKKTDIKEQATQQVTLDSK